MKSNLHHQTSTNICLYFMIMTMAKKQVKTKQNSLDDILKYLLKSLINLRLAGVDMVFSCK